MKNLNQENIVKLIAVRDNATYKSKDGSTFTCFAIVLEYCAGGELFDFVCDTGKFSEKVTRTYFHQMMSGLHYLHEKGYAHRDIKPENLLLNVDFKLKLADFGFAILWKGRDGSGILHTKLGTEGYMAP
jgi:serine/threonine protein kinase